MEWFFRFLQTDASTVEVDIAKVAAKVGKMAADNVDLPAVNDENEQRLFALGVQVAIASGANALAQVVPGITVE